MNWLHAQPIPAIPDDSKDRRHAIVTATRQLEDIKSRTPEIVSVAESVERHIGRNHFAERLERAYGLRR